MSTTYNEAATAAPTNSTARVATASIVGTAITHPTSITSWFKAALEA